MKKTLTRNTGDISRNEQQCLELSLEKPEKQEGLSEAEMCQVRNEKGLSKNKVNTPFVLLFECFTLFYD